MALRLRLRIHALPEPVLRVIMLALPVNARGRAACVCRSWRALLSDVSLWQVLDLTTAAAVARNGLTDTLVRGAVARAAGRLRVITFGDDQRQGMVELLTDALLDYGGEVLEEVNTDDYLSVDDIEALVAAAPRLQVLNANVLGECRELLPFVRNDAPYGSLRVGVLDAIFGRASAAAEEVALAAAVAAHESLKCLRLANVRHARCLNALVDAATQRRVSWLRIDDSISDAETVPALARLLQCNSLTKLEVDCDAFTPEQEASAPALCAALRTCRTLTHLELRLSGPHGVSRRTVTELLDAVAELPALARLYIWRSVLQDPAAFGRALGALLRANLPSFRSLCAFSCEIGNEGVAELLAGLAANTHLRVLDCGDNNLSAAFERDRLAPALAKLAARRELDARALR